jgi:hypothetical protein
LQVGSGVCAKDAVLKARLVSSTKMAV